MNLFLTIEFTLFALFSLVQASCDTNKKTRWDMCVCFAISIAAVLLTNILGGAL